MTLQKERPKTASHSVRDKRPKNVFQQLYAELRALPGFLRKWKKWELGIHLLVWIFLSTLFNIPNLDFTMGIFRSSDLSLIVPTLIGVPINMLLFYGNSLLVARYLKKDAASLAPLSFLLLGITCIEGLLDLLFYILFYGSISKLIIWEGLYGTFLMNSIFFFLPSYVYGSLKASLFEKEGPAKITIKDGHTHVLLSAEEILYLESDGNYVAFHTLRGKYLERTSLSKASERLPEQFIQCHKSYVINALSIAERGTNELKIGHHRIPIGRKYKANFN